MQIFLMILPLFSGSSIIWSGQFQALVELSILLMLPRSENVMAMGCWSEQEDLGGCQSLWQVAPVSGDGSHFQVLHKGKAVGDRELEAGR